MALMSPMIPSPSAGPTSAFSPWTNSPSSPAPFGAGLPVSNRSSGPSDSLAPPPSPYPQHIDPSPTDSNGTEGTEIEDDAQESQPEDESESTAGSDPQSPTEPEILAKIDTSFPARSRSNSDDAPLSVIHAPSGFRELDGSDTPLITANDIELPVNHSERGVGSPRTPDAALGPGDKRMSATSPLVTDVAQARSIDRSTPRASTRQEAEEDIKRRSRRVSSLEDIPEALSNRNSDQQQQQQPVAFDVRTIDGTEPQFTPLKTALTECWTLCNTLANLSSTHRQRMFTSSGKGSTQEHAWRTCWRLCQQLYESHNQTAAQAEPTLEYCRDFCQALFEVRQRGDEVSDSILRVSFEMNNHLYNTHDRNLPEAFRERTLDFYVTLCHRLMRQRTSLAEETDALLRACWSLAEMLFNLRQAGRESRAPDEELLGSAVQACWDLCDLFRDGWTQIRPDRGTPRPSQTTFPAGIQHSSTHSERPSSSLSSSSYHDAPSLPPETPTTIFDDTTAASSPETGVPSILVLGPSNTTGSLRGAHHERWSSNASSLSDYSESASSQRTSSTATAGSEGSNLLRLRYLILKAAMIAGFDRTSNQQLPAFIKNMPSNAFGTLPWQVDALNKYKELVRADASMKTANSLPSRRLGSKEVAKAVRWLGTDTQWSWMKDLFWVVFGFTTDDPDRKSATVQV